MLSSIGLLEKSQIEIAYPVKIEISPSRMMHTATGKELHFRNAHQANGWVVEALRWAVENAIINGKCGGGEDVEELSGKPISLTRAGRRVRPALVIH